MISSDQFEGEFIPRPLVVTVKSLPNFWQLSKKRGALIKCFSGTFVELDMLTSFLMKMNFVVNIIIIIMIIIQEVYFKIGIDWVLRAG